MGAGPDGPDGKPAPPPVRLGYDAASARDWWKNFVFGKTFVERRSLWSMYRCGAGRRGAQEGRAGALVLPACPALRRVACHMATWPHTAAPPPTRTFYRVWAFLILEFHFMAVMLWG